MTYQPVVPMTGYAGWKFLSRTIEQQKETFSQSAEIKRDVDYFREKIGTVSTAEELVSDHRLLTVSLTAFGLEDDIYAKAFVQKVLEDGTLDTTDLANKLSDKRYAAFSKAFGFGNFDTPNTVMSDFADDIISKYQDHSFEVAIGDVDNDMRLALNLSTGLEQITETASTTNGQWLGIMGNTALRSVFETALGFPSSFAGIDIDQQLAQFKDRAERVFGTSDVSEFLNGEKQEDLIKQFLIRSELNSYSTSTTGSLVLQLFQ